MVFSKSEKQPISHTNSVFNVSALKYFEYNDAIPSNASQGNFLLSNFISKIHFFVINDISLKIDNVESFKF